MTATPQGARRAGTELEFLARLGAAMLEAGYATEPMTQMVTACAGSFGLREVIVSGLGRVVRVECRGDDGFPQGWTVAAANLDSFDCDRMKRLKDLARTVIVDGTEPATALRLLEHADQGPKPWPWWFVTLGGALLALCIALQVGGTPAAAFAAAVILPPVSILGRGLAAAGIPRLYALAIQTPCAAALAAGAHALALITVTDSAVAIATVWVLLVPLPQLMTTAIDCVSSDNVTATARAVSALLAVAGIAIGGTVVVALSQRFPLGDPISPDLPQLPVWLVLCFSILGALGNAVFNHGGWNLFPAAAAAGLLAATVNQTLIHLANMPPVWSSPIAAIALGFAAAASSELLRLPVSALTLVGLTGALLPGLTLYQGLVIELFHVSGVSYFVQTFAICAGLGAGAAGGVLLYSLGRRAA
ncbi:threonine/serine exporter family protein [Nocardia goodfellowii]|uniref:Uncharacterized membrane protein YjjP (DUF1212 family) n=1 Tax=Nocardia goodfellowii TaxID=882446 RepID=A0ABS4QIG0_9NOCA|nr:threonine/serine exporter family protein [Nocardia goodfellowii]MBP2191481.1 uncharacterized membrane protein YjjP (DUF1212 family) [Nocardia goodfellowii]